MEGVKKEPWKGQRKSHGRGEEGAMESNNEGVEIAHPWQTQTHVLFDALNACGCTHAPVVHHSVAPHTRYGSCAKPQPLQWYTFENEQRTFQCFSEAVGSIPEPRPFIVCWRQGGISMGFSIQAELNPSHQSGAFHPSGAKPFHPSGGETFYPRRALKPCVLCEGWGLSPSYGPMSASASAASAAHLRGRSRRWPRARRLGQCPPV
eukprot:358608-Chlamydomonas_euryale.AAC.2